MAPIGLFFDISEVENLTLIYYISIGRILLRVKLNK
jgi:hypothetical protein